jgi:hypothetical protein
MRRRRNLNWIAQNLRPEMMIKAGSGFDGLDIKHLVGGAKTDRFIEAPAFFGGMQSHHADTATACFSKGKFNQFAGQMAAAILRLNVDIQQIAAQGGTRIERMWRPVEQQQAGAGNHIPLVFGKPAKIALVGYCLGDPRFVGLSHQLENLIVAAAGIDKHAATMASNERSIGGGRQPGLQHVEQYKT